MATIKRGLILSGGGAKGAYEVGVIKALARIGYEPEVVSGASIGSLNGAVVAASPDMRTAAEDLEEVWSGLNPDKVLKLNRPSSRYIELAALHALMQAALNVSPAGILASLSSVSKLFQVFSEEDRKYMAILDESPLEEVLDMAIDFDSLLGEHGKEFYAAVYPSAGGNVPGAVCDTLRYVLSRGESVFPRLKDFGREDARRILMASSAIPVAFRAIDVKGETFRDGGMGDRVRVQGNTPARPLADAGCTHAVVVTLDQGVLWDRNEWPEMTALEIRPTFDIAAGSSIKALVNFSPVRIQELIDRGERDAMQCLGDVSMALGLVGEMRRSQSKVQAALATELEIDRAYNRSMDTIRGDLLK